MAQLEGLVATMGVAFADYSLNGNVWDACGNWDANAAPHDVFPCQGYDAWCAIACYTEEQWQALCMALEGPAWTQDSRFATLEGRLENVAELNDHLGDWTRERTPREAMRLLQRAGVPAGLVASGEDLYNDLNLRARDYIMTVDHRPAFGVLEHPGATVRLSETPSRVVGPCPEFGQHNQEVFGDLLGLSQDEIQQLVEDKVLY
jgi:crotonobetainyl-CoA:carnitine CoA-transferase CaiB-like acyl-CoA transferase